MSVVYDTASQIVNDTAEELGKSAVADPYSSSDPIFTQLRALLNSVGREMNVLYDWQELTEEHQFTTQATDSGVYDLPSNFGRMINQTGWERKENVPLWGPLSAQDWTYLLGRDLVAYTIYASFRIKEGKFYLFPFPPPDGLDINFEYLSNLWARGGADPDFTYSSRVLKGTDQVLYEPILTVKHLKAKYLESKGFDSTAARNELGLMFDALTGQEKGAPILNAAYAGRGYPYLEPYRNLPDTGYGR